MGSKLEKIMRFIKTLLVILTFASGIAYSQLIPFRQWQQTYNNGNNSNMFYEMAVDTSGNVFYCNTKRGANTFPIPYIQKLNSAGVEQFVKIPSYPTQIRGVLPYGGIALDNNGNIFMAGALDSNDRAKGFVTKFDSNGDTLWNRYLGLQDTNNTVYWMDIKTDAAGNVFVGGYRIDRNSPYLPSVYAAKYSPNGDLLWLYQRKFNEGTLYTLNKLILELDNSGNIMMAFSRSRGTGDDYDMCAVKLSPAGVESWFYTYNNLPHAAADVVEDMKLDNAGNMYIGGYSCTITGTTTSDFTVMRLNAASGTQEWMYKSRGPYTSYTQDNRVRSISVNSAAGEVYAAGTIHNIGYRDMLLEKLNANTGTEIWRKTVPNVYDHILGSSLVDQSGDVYVAGIIYRNFNSYSFFTKKYSSAGTELWSKQEDRGYQVDYPKIKMGPGKSIYMATTNMDITSSVYALKYMQAVPQVQTVCRTSNKPITAFQTTIDTFTVSGLPSGSVIARIDVKIDTILHPNSTGLTGVLRSPGGIIDTLFKNPGDFNLGNNIINCTFSDTAIGMLGSFSFPPFTGYWKPFRPLEIFENAAPNGDWLFSVYSSSSTTDGTIKKYCLVIHYYDPQTIGIQQISNEVPKDYSLGQNYPNPFNPTTNIKFSIPKNGNVTLKVFDVLGKQIAELVNEYKTTGSYVVDFNAANLSSGVYFYRLETEGLIETKKMLLVK